MTCMKITILCLLSFHVEEKNDGETNAYDWSNHFRIIIK